MVNPRRPLHAPGDQAVTFVELFFDLVFVFAVTEITALTASHLTWSGVARSLLLFWLIWWAWTQFTWTLNPADTTHDVVRIITLVATGIAFIMATSVTRAFGSEVLWFAVPYLLVRLLGLGLQLRVDREHERRDPGTVLGWAALSLVGLALVLAGAFVDPPARNWIWLAAIGADLFAAGSAARRGRTWDIRPAHFSERHGLFVIIALGESLIVAATAISGADRTAALMGDVVAALVLACLLWWTYFGWLKEATERGLAAAGTRIGVIARDAFSFGHFPLVCGIIGFSVAIEEIVHHPDAAASGEVVASLGVGVALFVGSSAFVYWRTCGRLLGKRLAILLVTEGVLLLVAEQDPIWLLTTMAVGMLAIAVTETLTHHERAEDRAVEQEIPPADG
jgi:low temperature requirement protein LtrA